MDMLNQVNITNRAKLTNIDLNLFVVLDAVLRASNTSRAAEELHVTQSAVSNALARLRYVLDDKLVVRNRRGVSPTPHALAIAPQLRDALAALEAIAGARTSFDPQTTSRRFTLAGTDIITLTLVPRLSELLRARAPHAELRVITIEQLAETDGLAYDVDAMLGMPPVVPPRCHAEHAYEDDWVTIARRGHPGIGKRLTLDRFAALPHAEVAMFGEPDRGVDFALAKHGKKRHVIASVPQFAGLPIVVAQTDAIATVSRRLATFFAKLLPLEVRKVPAGIALERLEIRLIWHDRTDEDAGGRFFRTLVREALEPERS